MMVTQKTSIQFARIAKIGRINKYKTWRTLQNGYLAKKILCPSILNLSTDNMREEIEKLDATDMDIYHVDIMDGTFVPNFGMSVRELEMIRRITDAGHHKLIDCHMMIMNPHRYIKRIAEAGADIIYIHPESELIPSATLELIQLEGKRRA